MIVYQIQNLKDGKRYFGKTVRSLEARWKAHQRLEDCPYLYNAIRKHGSRNFSVKVRVADIKTNAEANAWEKAFILHYRTNDSRFGYNLTRGGEGTLGRKSSRETREKISLARKGYHHSKEARRKMSLAKKGRHYSNEHRKKISLALIGNQRMKGHHLSKETRRKMSIAHRKN